MHIKYLGEPPLLTKLALLFSEPTSAKSDQVSLSLFLNGKPQVLTLHKRTYDKGVEYPLLVNILKGPK